MSVPVAIVAGIAALRALLCLRQIRCLAAAGVSYASYASAQTWLRLALALAQAAAAGVVLAVLARLGEVQDGAPWVVAAVLWLACADLMIAAARSFLVDARFGFNRLGAGRFAGEAALGLGLRALVAWPAALLAFALAQAFGDAWWLFFVAIAALASALAGGWLYPAFVQPRLEGQAALTSGALAQRLHACLQRCGFAHAQLVVARGSARSAHANARAENIGRGARVVLLDTLRDRLAPEQVEAVVAHELGHLALRHPVLRHLLVSLLWLIAAGIAELATRRVFPQAGWSQIIAVLALAPQLRFLIQPLLMRSLRAWEFQADAFAARHGYAPQLLAALAELVQANAAAPAFDPWFAAFHLTHPPLGERRRRLAGS